MPKKLTKNEFILRAITLHGDKYDYSKVDYKNSRKKVNIICTTHGDFLITPAHHLKGHGCKHCTYYKDKTSTEYFIDKASKVHGNYYDYSKTEYENSSKKVNITCPEHGDFKQAPSSHLSGTGCPVCSRNSSIQARTRSTEDFIKDANNVHLDTYDYSLTSYVNNTTQVKILCKKHGLFYQTPEIHLKGAGCQKCAIERTSISKQKDTEWFVRKGNKVHNNKYDYSDTDYTSSKELLTISCPIHRSFEQTAEGHLQGKGCPKCGRNLSKAEDTIISHIESLGLEVQQSNRSLISPYELDIIIPEKKIAIEYNGIRWHSEKFGKDKYYHKNKTNLCKDKGYRLIHIWEDDFINDPKKELDFISYCLGTSSQKKVYARQTTIKNISNKEGRAFLDKHHIQGSGTGTFYYGMFLEDELIAVTSFLVKKDHVELTRHTSDRQIVGGLGKVTKLVSKEFKQDILSFCDLSRFDGKSYLTCGYEIDKELLPDYKYVVGNERQHKFVWRKKNIEKKLPDIYSPDLTEKEMMELADIPRIWDCGKLRLIYKFKQVGVQE